MNKLAEKSPTGGSVTEPLREEHRHLLPHIEHLRAAADAVGVVPTGTLRVKVDEAYAFLTDELIPHARAEDEVLYPEVDRVLGGQPVTATMARDHVAVAELTDELGRLAGSLREPASEVTEQHLRRVLYGVYELVKVHFAKEEEILLPVLDQRLTASQARELFEQMEQAGGHPHG